jgi:DNA-binding response OmpR family regulator
MRPALLVVEDDSATRTLLTVLARRAGYDVDAIGDGADAMTLLSRVEYSALICDLHLPVTSGHDVLAFIESSQAEMLHHTIVVSSTHPREIDSVRGRYPMVPVLRKPFDVEVLTAELTRITNRRQQRERDLPAEFCRLSIISGAKAGVLMLKDAREEMLNVVDSFGYDANVVERFAAVPADSPYPAAVAYRRASPVWLESPATLSAKFPAAVEPAQSNRSYALAALPLMRNGKAFGVAGWSFREAHQFSDEERKRFEAIAASLSNSLVAAA